MKKIFFFSTLFLVTVYASAQCTPVLNLEFSGNSLDSSGNNNTAIASGTPTLTADRFGNPNAAYDFGGFYDVDYFTVANSPSLQFTNQMSISYWFKQCSFGGMDGWGSYAPQGNHVIVGKAGDGGSAQPGFWNMLAVDAGNHLNWTFCNKNGYAVTPNFCVSTGYNCIDLCEWIHVVFVIDNTVAKTYFNGTLVVSQTINPVDFTVSNTKPLYIGKMDGVWYPYKGIIDDLKVYNCAIDQTTINALNGGFVDPLNANSTPAFNQVAAICSGASLAALPTTSNNGITGTWSPALDNTATTTYIFTPDTSQCANTTTMTITVNPTPASPAFTQAAPICSGASLAALPTTSNNGITGIWSPTLDNTATTTYTFTPTAGQCANATTMTITVNPAVTPVFTQVVPICSGAALAALPTTSNNGITGTWAPALDNTATATYTFTPTAGQCATAQTMAITVNSAVAPVFTQAAPICSGASLAALPTTSNNGITGIWSPTLDNTATTTYTFTPSAGQCANATTMTITVNPAVTPAFTQVVPICSGAALVALPATSNNGITGTWSPALDNTATTTYTFTPDTGQCANTTTMIITVNPAVTPVFTQVVPICSGAALAALPTTSNNGITGTWLPALDNTATATYTFTPTAGQCATATTMIITVNPAVTPVFTQAVLICSGAVLAALPTTSNNGITGIWSPTLDNTATTTYTFTPDTGQCATATTMIITVNPAVTPVFTQVVPICSGASLAALPTTSNNGITGTWLPALDNTATATYTFTPTAGQCATATTMIITVNPAVTPVFTQAVLICSGAVLAALPTTSNNGITGIWSPTLDNTATTTYTFTPTAGQCANATTMTITVNPAVTPAFTQAAPICSGATLAALPAASNNGITGTWAPALDNTATTTYTFTPTAGQCATAQTMTIIVTLNNLDFSVNIYYDFSDHPYIVISAISPNNNALLYQLDNDSFQSSNQFDNLGYGEHQITVSDNFSCYQKTKSITIFGFPKFFTPNGDGYNDLWHILGNMDDSQMEVFIFDRYGKFLKKLDKNHYFWDGTYNGTLMFSNDYWFKIEYTNSKGEKKEFKSHFALKR